MPTTRPKANTRLPVPARGARVDLSGEWLLQMDDICALFDVTEPTIFRWVRTGKIPRPMTAISTKRWYWLSSDLRKFLARVAEGGRPALQPA